MNYRHQFHAGNFADVFKHALLVQLVRALQQKEKGFLYVDTHAGRGRYDLAAAAQGDSLARRPEWPEGVGRLWSEPATPLPPALADYVAIARRFDAEAGGTGAVPQLYPGSPRIVRMLARPQDRLALCEKHEEEFFALSAEFRTEPRVQVQERDGYAALRALLPPPERRALVLIDPPFEAQDEFAQIAAALGEGLRRLPAGVLAVWYPLTERARTEAFFAELLGLALPPTLRIELAIAGEAAAIKLRGCGLVVLNPPWQFEQTAESLVKALAERLAQAPGGGARIDWIVPE